MNEAQTVLELTDATFDAAVLDAPVPVLVDFTARWCGPCKMLAPVLEAMAAESGGRFKIAKVDLEASPGLARRFGVTAAPTLLVFRGGQRRAQRVGAATKRALLALLDE